MNLSTKSLVWIGLLVAVAVAVVLSPFASKSPDGLEKVAEDKGFLQKGAGEPLHTAPAPDYAVPGIKSEWLSTPLAGVLGTLLTFGAGIGLAWILKRRTNSSNR